MDGRENAIPDRYLGDGVYASYDGWHVYLDLRAQDPNIRIALEPSVLRALDEYRDALVARLAEMEERDG